MTAQTASVQGHQVALGVYVNPFAGMQKGIAGKSGFQNNLLTSPANTRKFADLIENLDRQVAPAAKTGAKIASAADVPVADVKDSSKVSFWDMLDLVNPLQHIPVVSSVYRAVTGDEIHPEFRMAGNFITGAMMGPVGLAVGLTSASVDYATDKPVGDHLLDAVALNPAKSSQTATVTLAALDPEATVTPGQASSLYAQTAASLGERVEQLKTPAMPITAASQRMTNPLASPDEEAQALARTVAADPNAIVNITPGAAAQLSALATGHDNGNSLATELGALTGDGTQQLRAVTAKNRQLGLALDSSANINQALSTAEQRQISTEISNKVAALYQQSFNGNSLSRTDAVEQSSFDQLFEQEALRMENHQPLNRPAPAPKSRVAEAAESPQHYHGLTDVTSTSIAAAMQKALDKYQNLRRN